MNDQRGFSGSWWFIIIVLTASALLWGSLALFRIPAISFVGATRGPVWAVTLYIAGGFVPSVAAIVLTGIRDGRGGIAVLSRSAVGVRIGWRWYLTSIGVVAAGTLGQILLNLSFGNRFDIGLFGTQLPTLVPLFILGPVSEELGWRGYLLPRLQLRFSPWTSSLIVGAAWGLWHLPLFYIVGTSQNKLALPFAGFFFGLIAVSIIMTWIMNNSGGSLFSAIFFHWIYTYAMQVTATGVTRSPAYNWLEYAPYVLIAAAVIVFANPRDMRATAAA